MDNMNDADFKRAVRWAAQHLQRPDRGPGFFRDPDLDDPNDLVSYALLSCAGAGPFEAQATALADAANSLTMVMSAVADELDAAGIPGRETVVERVKELVRQRDLMRQDRRPT